MTPKSQHLVLKGSGQWTWPSREADQGDNVKLEEFFTTNTRVEVMMDEEMFEAKNVAGVSYVNDIHLLRDMVSDGDIWSMFINLG